MVETDKRKRRFQVNEIISHEWKFKHILSKHCRQKHTYWGTYYSSLNEKENEHETFNKWKLETNKWSKWIQFKFVDIFYVVELDKNLF